MKRYFRRLWRAICNKDYYPYYYSDYKYPLVWELDNYIINLVRVNLPNYNSWSPLWMKEKEREEIKKEMIRLANNLSSRYSYYKEWKYDIKKEEQDTERFKHLLCNHFNDLRD